MLGLQNDEALCCNEHPVCKEYPKSGGSSALRFFQKGGNDAKNDLLCSWMPSVRHNFFYRLHLAPLTSSSSLLFKLFWQVCCEGGSFQALTKHQWTMTLASAIRPVALFRPALCSNVRLTARSCQCCRSWRNGTTSTSWHRFVASLRCWVKRQRSFQWMKGFFWNLDPTAWEVVPRPRPRPHRRQVVHSKSLQMLIWMSRGTARTVALWQYNSSCAILLSK